MRRTYAPGESPVEEISVAGLQVPVRIKRHPRARRMTLRVSQCRKGVVLTLPRACKSGEAHNFVAKNIPWIKQHLNALPDEVAFSHGAIIPVRGTPHELAFVGRTVGRGVVWLSPAQPAFDGLFEAHETASEEKLSSAAIHRHVCKLNIAGDTAHAPRRLQDWLIQQAR
ncbi:MAG: YgjP-like metallopeptidase domain-containing protein, partial [Pseudomonadota bacterium]